MPEEIQKTDQFVSPANFAYVQDMAAGTVATFVGPCQCNPGTGSPVKYDPVNRVFVKCTLRESTKPCCKADKGEYLILRNPVKQYNTESSATYDQPFKSGGDKTMPANGLDWGKTINIPGPIQFALWPGQDAITVPGHRLRSNEYLVVRVIDDVQAQANWGTAVITKATAVIDETEVSFTLGQLINIKGTEYSFFIPPTGVEVVPWFADSDAAHKNPLYIREACTVPDMYYCILNNENGSQRYAYGPDVVFPEPTEEFYRTTGGARKFPCVELSGPKAGIHVKVIAEYTDEDGTVHGIGKELWFTGDTTPVYKPRPQHHVITYGDDGQQVHYGVVVPKGQARYKMDRKTGKTTMVNGEDIVLCDPRTEVLARRWLDEQRVDLWYPGNSSAATYNKQLQAVQEATGVSSQTQAVTEEVLKRSGLSMRDSYRAETTSNFAPLSQSPGKITRPERWTPPRMITLGGDDSRFSGVPRICPWDSYAVQVVGADGSHQVVLGPTPHLMEFDEDLTILKLSAGTPKGIKASLETVYLQYLNNRVSDKVTVTTSDGIEVEVWYSLMIDFDLEKKDSWFKVEDYTKLVTDRCRSILRGRVREVTINEFYKKSTKLIRDFILGEAAPLSEEDQAATGKQFKRPLLRFSENGMIVKDVHVGDPVIKDVEIKEELEQAQRVTIRNEIAIQARKQTLEAAKQEQEMAQEKEKAVFATEKVRADLAVSKIELALATATKELDKRKSVAAQEADAKQLEESVKNLIAACELARAKNVSDFEIAKAKTNSVIAREMLEAETQAKEAILKAAAEGMNQIAAILNEGHNLEVLSQTMNIQGVISSVRNAAGGKGLIDILKDLLQGTPAGAGLENALKGSQLNIPVGRR